jgi:transposase
MPIVVLRSARASPAVAQDPAPTLPPRPHDHGPFAPPAWTAAAPQAQLLEQRLADQHLARRIVRAVDTLDLQPLFASFRRGGSLAHRPDLMLRVVLYELHLGHTSPAAWARHAHENEPVRWLAQGIEPSRSRWYAFRDRLGPLLDDWHRQVLHQAQAQELTPATQGVGDGTTVAALASRQRLLNETRLHERLQQLEQVMAAPTPTAAATPTPLLAPTAVPATPALPSWMAKTATGQHQHQQRYRRAAQRLQELLRRNQQRRAKERRPRHQIVVSASDPEAALGLDKLKVFRPLYNVQWIVDLTSPLIFAYEVFAQPNDAGTLPTLLQRSAQALGHPLTDVIMDGSYASGRDAATAEAAAVRLFAPWGNQQRGTAPAAAVPQFAKEQFRWEPSRSHYQCPQRHPLELVSTKQEKEATGASHAVSVYRCAPEHCQHCPVHTHCTKSPAKGRTVTRSEFEESVERLKARMQTPEAKALYRQRKQTVELGFADWKQHRKVRCFTCWGRERVRTQVGLSVLVHNLLTVEHRRDQPLAKNTQSVNSSETRT